MFNFCNPFYLTSPYTGIPTSLGTNGFGSWTTMNTNPYLGWYTPYTGLWSGISNYVNPTVNPIVNPIANTLVNPWHAFFQAFFINLFEVVTAWQIHMMSTQNPTNFTNQQGVPSVPFFGPNFRNGWTTPTQDFAGTGYAQRAA